MAPWFLKFVNKKKPNFTKGTVSIYIQYTMVQLCLPMDLEEDIPENHLVRVINAAVNRLDEKIFSAAYPDGGRDSYHPKMLTKIIIYAYNPADLLFPSNR